MEVSKLKRWADSTMNFEPAALKVFQRLILGNGPGLLVLWGGEPTGEKANKSLFLGMVKAFETDASLEEPYISSKFPNLWILLKQLGEHQYQCIDVKQIWKRFTPEDEIYKVPLDVVVSYALAFEGKAHGLSAGREVVLICDDIEKFMRFNAESNEQFLLELARKLDGQDSVTFLGASQLIWHAQEILGWERVVQLNWD